MSRGRKPKPTHLKLVQGNPGRRPLNKDEPAPKREMPEPPAELCSDAREEWGRVSVELHSIGLLTRVDRGVLGAYCQSYARWISAERILRGLADRGGASAALLSKTSNGNLIQNPLVGIANKAMADMVRYAAEFGMTPSARSRIQVNGENVENDDPASRFLT